MGMAGPSSNSQRPAVRAFKAVGGTPLFFRKAQGSRFWDADGRVFIDFVGSWGPLILGHAALVIVGIAIAAAVGLSRIYLRAHYWSDVAGGWGIGCGIFATLAAMVLVDESIRHNGGRREQEPPLAKAER